VPLVNPLPVPLTAALGGTNDTGSAWSTYSPAVTANSGSFTSVSAAGRYKDLGKTRFITVSVTVTTVGTAAASATIPLPNGTTAAASTLSAQDANDGTAGADGGANIASGAASIIWSPGNGAVITAGHVYLITGTIEMV
jgi:hypothetical protein